MNTECPRHRGFLKSRDEAIRTRSYYVERCTHIGSRFVVQVNSWDHHWTAIDYVEDVSDDEVIVEARSTGDVREEDVIWDELERKLRDGIPPDPD